MGQQPVLERTRAHSNCSMLKLAKKRGGHNYCDMHIQLRSLTTDVSYPSQTIILTCVDVETGADMREVTYECSGPMNTVGNASPYVLWIVEDEMPPVRSQPAFVDLTCSGRYVGALWKG